MGYKLPYLSPALRQRYVVRSAYQWSIQWVTLMQVPLADGRMVEVAPAWIRATYLTPYSMDDPDPEIYHRYHWGCTCESVVSCAHVAAGQAILREEEWKRAAELVGQRGQTLPIWHEDPKALGELMISYCQRVEAGEPLGQRYDYHVNRQDFMETYSRHAAIGEDLVQAAEVWLKEHKHLILFPDHIKSYQAVAADWPEGLAKTGHQEFHWEADSGVWYCTACRLRGSHGTLPPNKLKCGPAPDANWHFAPLY